MGAGEALARVGGGSVGQQEDEGAGFGCDLPSLVLWRVAVLILLLFF